MTVRRSLTSFAAIVLLLTFDAGTGTAAADTGTSNGATYAVELRSVDAGSGWKLNVGQLSGGDPKVAAAFDRASMASGQSMIGMLNRDNVYRDNATFEGTPTVRFQPSAISQVLIGVYFYRSAAHPLDYVSTVVIDTRNAKPITFDNLFSDKQAGLARLSQQTKLLFPKTNGGERPMRDTTGNAPIEQNFHNWIPTPSGLEIHFEDYQFAHGLPVITVPWTQLTDVLSPDMQVLAQ